MRGSPWTPVSARSLLRLPLHPTKATRCGTSRFLRHWCHCVDAWLWIHRGKGRQWDRCRVWLGCRLRAQLRPARRYRSRAVDTSSQLLTEETVAQNLCCGGLLPRKCNAFGAKHPSRSPVCQSLATRTRMCSFALSNPGSPTRSNPYVLRCLAASAAPISNHIRRIRIATTTKQRVKTQISMAAHVMRPARAKRIGVGTAKHAPRSLTPC